MKEMPKLIDELMVIAMIELRERLPENMCTDDWQWNDKAFQFVLLIGDGSDSIVTDPYRFCYDPDEEYAGTAEEQLYDWLDRCF